MRHGGGCLAGAGLGNSYNFTVPETERHGGHLDRRYVHLFFRLLLYCMSTRLPVRLGGGRDLQLVTVYSGEEATVL
jgi:hypothetical protein